MLRKGSSTGLLAVACILAIPSTALAQGGVDPAAVPVAPACPDPAAVAIGIGAVRTRVIRGVTNYEFRIVGTVRNLGSVEYRSTGTQQNAIIRRLPYPDAPSGAQIGESNWPIVAPGGEFQAQSTAITGWVIGTPQTQVYELLITYAPSVLTDTNPANNDCDLTNNSIRITPTEIDALLPAAL